LKRESGISMENGPETGEVSGSKKSVLLRFPKKREQVTRFRRGEKKKRAPAPRWEEESQRQDFGGLKRAGGDPARQGSLDPVVERGGKKSQ